MKNAIEQNGPDSYRLKVRGCTMTLSRLPEGGWTMMTDNASARAWSGIPASKTFDDLQAVETHYRSWRGIRALLEGHPVKQ